MFNHSSFARHCFQRGLTLVEMLVATALTLIMFAAVAQIFGMMGDAMHDARATIEMSGNLRSAGNFLQHDLNNVSVEVLPWVQPGAGQGYFEIVEGPDRDIDFAAVDSYPLDGTTITSSLAGDGDDIISFTAYSRDEPFVGLVPGVLRSMSSVTPVAGHTQKFFIDFNPASPQFTIITSHYAEIVYFTKLTDFDDRNLYTGVDNDQRDPTETVTLYRRVFLIRPDIFIGDPTAIAPPNSESLTPAQAWNYFDLAMRDVGRVGTQGPGDASAQWNTVSLEDLQDRNNRLARGPRAVAYDGAPIRPQELRSFEQLNNLLGAGSLRDRTGEDVVLNRVLAFDVKVFDPGAPVRADADQTVPVEPDDAYDLNDPNTLLSGTDNMSGAFVDLHWTAGGREVDFNSSGQFANAPLRDLSGMDVLDARLFRGTAPTNFAGLQAAFPNLPSRLQLAGDTSANTGLTYSYYDTWPYLYESDGNNQDGDGATDEGTNGFDDDGDGVVDEGMRQDTDNDGSISAAERFGELETSPPYPVPLRGISVTLRVIEESTRQVRQDTVMADFMPK